MLRRFSRAEVRFSRHRSISITEMFDGSMRLLASNCRNPAPNHVLRESSSNSSSSRISWRLISAAGPTGIPKILQIFDFGRAAAYNAALSTDYIPEESWKRTHGRTFPVQEHHAPQGPAGCPEVETVLQAGAGNHRRGQNGPTRSFNECAAARRDHLR